MTEIDLQKLSHQAQDLVDSVVDTERAREFWKENPYLIIGAAAGLGYVLAGGLPTPFTRRLIRVGMKALFVPVAASQLKSFATSVSDQGLES